MIISETVEDRGKRLAELIDADRASAQNRGISDMVPDSHLEPLEDQERYGELALLPPAAAVRRFQGVEDPRDITIRTLKAEVERLAADLETDDETVSGAVRRTDAALSAAAARSLLARLA